MPSATAAISASSTSASSSAWCVRPRPSCGGRRRGPLRARGRDRAGRDRTVRDPARLVRRPLDDWGDIHFSKRLRARIGRAAPPIDLHERLVLRRYRRNARGPHVRESHQRSGGLWLSSRRTSGRRVRCVGGRWDAPASRRRLLAPQLAFRRRRKKAQFACGFDTSTPSPGHRRPPAGRRARATSAPPSASTRGRPHRRRAAARARSAPARTASARIERYRSPRRGARRRRSPGAPARHPHRGCTRARVRTGACRDELLGRVVGEVDLAREARAQAGIRLEEVVHQARVAGNDDDQPLAIVLHPLEQRLHRLGAEAPARVT